MTIGLNQAKNREWKKQKMLFSRQFTFKDAKSIQKMQLIVIYNLIVQLIVIKIYNRSTATWYSEIDICKRSALPHYG